MWHGHDGVEIITIAVYYPLHFSENNVHMDDQVCNKLSVFPFAKKKQYNALI